MMLHVLLVVVCLASMSLSATSTTLKQGRYAMMFVQRKWTANNYAINFSLHCSGHQIGHGVS